MSNEEERAAPDLILVVRRAAVAAISRELLDRALGVVGEPVVPIGMQVRAIPDDHDHAILLVARVDDAGKLIGALQEWADRNGLSYALQAATARGRAWARSIP